MCVNNMSESKRKWAINHTDVIFNDKDLPICCGLWAFETSWMSSLNDTDFSNETDLSEINGTKKERDTQTSCGNINMNEM